MYDMKMHYSMLWGRGSAVADRRHWTGVRSGLWSEDLSWSHHCHHDHEYMIIMIWDP